MDKTGELRYKIEQIKYDIGTKEMELAGLKKMLRDYKEHIVINIGILLVILLFYSITIWGNYDNVVSKAFIMVLKPLYYAFAVVYIVKFIIKPIYEMYINSNLETARMTAMKKGVDSVSIKKEICEKELSILKMRLREAEEELAKEVKL